MKGHNQLWSMAEQISTWKLEHLNLTWARIPFNGEISRSNLLSLLQTPQMMNATRNTCLQICSARSSVRLSIVIIFRGLAVQRAEAIVSKSVAMSNRFFVKGQVKITGFCEYTWRLYQPTDKYVTSNLYAKSRWIWYVLFAFYSHFLALSF